MLKFKTFFQIAIAVIIVGWTLYNLITHGIPLH